MKTKICIIPAGYKPLPPVKGGAVETLVQNFIDINEKKEQLEFLVLSVEDSAIKNTGDHYLHTQYIYFHGNEKLDKFYYWCVYKVLKKFFHIIIPDYLLKYRMVKYIQKKQDEFDWIIFEAGEIDCLKYYSRILEPKKIIMHSHGEVRNERKLESCLQYYLAVSEFVRTVWQETVKSSPERSITLLNGINQDKFKEKLTDSKRNEIREKFAFSNQDIVLVYVGRIVPEKGVKELLKAVEYLPEQYKLLMIGSADFGQKSVTKYEEDVKKIISKLGHRVKFTGYIPNEEIGVYYQIGDISVVPSMFNDPAPLVIIEAMAAGLPIVTTGSGGIREYCDETCAEFVDRGTDFEYRMARTIEKIGNDKEKCMAMSVCAREKAKNYTDEVQYINFVKILEDLRR